MSDTESLKHNATSIAAGLDTLYTRIPELATFEDNDSPPMTEKEWQILQAYDRLLELELEASLLRVQEAVAQGSAPQLSLSQYGV